MQQTQRFKRVATARRKKCFWEKTEPDHDSVSLTGRRSKSVTVKSSKPEISSVPISGPSFERMTVMPPEFFQIDALDLAPRLLGKFLRRDDVVLRITEVIMFCNSVRFSGKCRKREEKGEFFLTW